MKNILKTFALTLVIFTSSHHTTVAQSIKRNSIVFFEIDDWVEVYVEGKMVYKKMSKDGHIGKEINFDLNPFIKGKKTPLVEIKLINAVCATCSSSNGWVIEFEVFQNGESVDYIVQEGNSVGGDTVYSVAYNWGEI